MADYYNILGVARGASKEDIKKAYHALAKKYHPDKNQGDEVSEKKFKEINAAYDVLKDDQKRAAYDRFGEEAFTGGGNRAGGSQGFNFGFGGMDFSSGGSFSDIFEDLFNGGLHRQQKTAPNTRGSDLRYNMEINLEEAYRGDKKTIKINTFTSCDDCGGSGSQDKKESSECKDCDGAGRTRTQQGFFTIERTCNTCQGSGSVIKNPCKKCRGQGRIRTTRTLSVNIPKGVEEGTRIRLSGEGESGIRGGEPGDLYIFVSIKQHPIFIRDGNDIHCRVPVKMTIAALGGSIEVPTLDGARARVTIPSGTQTGHKFRLKEKGMSIMRSQDRFGDMYVHAIVETPVNISDKQKELLKQFDEESENNNPESEGFFRKVKDFLDEFRK